MLPNGRRRNQNPGPGPGQSAQTFSYAAPRTPIDPPGWLDAKPWACPMHSNCPGLWEVGGRKGPRLDRVTGVIKAMRAILTPMPPIPPPTDRLTAR